MNNNKIALEFCKKYIWKEIHPDPETCKLILYTILKQFNKWTVGGETINFGGNKINELVWLKTIVPYLCHENPCVKVLNGHTSYVRSVMKLNDTTIVSRSDDGNFSKFMDSTLRVWDLLNDTSRVLNGHTGPVESVMKLNETTIVSGSRDRTLRVWDLTNDTSRVLRGHTNTVWSVMKLNETTIVSGSGEGTIKVWDLTKL